MNAEQPVPHSDTSAIRNRRLGDILVERQIVSAADIAKALAFQEQFGGRIGSVLVRLGAVSEDTLLLVLAEQLGMPLLQGDEWPEGGDAIRAALGHTGYGITWWQDNGVIAWETESQDDDTPSPLLVVARDPLDPLVNEALERGFVGRQFAIAAVS